MFLTQILTLLKQQLILSVDVERNRDEIIKLRKDFQELALIVESLKAEVRHAEQRVESERLKMRLEAAENSLSEFQRRLPPARGAKKVK